MVCAFVMSIFYLYFMFYAFCATYLRSFSLWILYEVDRAAFERFFICSIAAASVQPQVSM